MMDSDIHQINHYAVDGIAHYLNNWLRTWLNRSFSQKQRNTSLPSYRGFLPDEAVNTDGMVPCTSGEHGRYSDENAYLPPMWPGFESCTRHHRWVDVGSCLAPRAFLKDLRSPSFHKNQHLNSNLAWKQWMKSPSVGCTTVNSLMNHFFWFAGGNFEMLWFTGSRNEFSLM